MVLYAGFSYLSIPPLLFYSSERHTKVESPMMESRPDFRSFATFCAPPNVNYAEGFP